MENSVSIIGLGYIGLPTALALTDSGVRVSGVEISSRRVDEIRTGKCPIAREEGASAMLVEALSSGMLTIHEMPQVAPVHIVAVPTPLVEATSKPDLSLVKKAVEGLAPVLRAGDLVILESTSPVGTTEKLGHWISMKRPDLTIPSADEEGADISIAYCPERVLPGRIMYELRNNDRIVGGVTKRCTSKAKKVYENFCRGEILAVNSSRTAEMVKLVENTFRDINIGFANELSMLAERMEVDVNEVIASANRHPRVNILQPGIGVGGHCIAVDPYFLFSENEDICKLAVVARASDQRKREWVVRKIESIIEDYISRRSPKRIVFLGMAFKPDVGDIRNSPALDIIGRVAQSFSDHQIFVHDPHCKQLPIELSHYQAQILGDLTLNTGDLVFKLVAHSAYESINSLSLEVVNLA